MFYIEIKKDISIVDEMVLQQRITNKLELKDHQIDFLYGDQIMVDRDDYEKLEEKDTECLNQRLRIERIPKRLQKLTEREEISKNEAVVKELNNISKLLVQIAKLLK